MKRKYSPYLNSIIDNLCLFRRLKFYGFTNPKYFKKTLRYNLKLFRKVLRYCFFDYLDTQNKLYNIFSSRYGDNQIKSFSLNDALFYGKVIITKSPHRLFVNHFKSRDNFGEFFRLRDLVKLTFTNKNKLSCEKNICIWHEPLGKNYYHFLFDHILYLNDFINYSKEYTSNSKLILIGASEFSQWQVDLIELIGIDRKRLVSEKKPLSIKNLSIFETPTTDLRSVSIKPLIERYRKTVFDKINITDNGTRRIYVSRKASKLFSRNRHIRNEEALLQNSLVPLGFEPVTLESKSIKEQIQIFSQAEVIVAAHGASLTNLIYSNGVTLIELNHKHDYWSAYYQELCKQMEHNYYKVESEEELFENGDFNVNISDLESKLNQVLS